MVGLPLNRGSVQRFCYFCPGCVIYSSLFTDPLFSLQSPSSAGDRIQTAGDLLTASARGQWWGKKNYCYYYFSFSRTALASLGSRVRQCFRKERNEKLNNVCVRSIYLQGFSGDFFRQNAAFFFSLSHDPSRFTCVKSFAARKAHGRSGGAVA